MNQILIFVFDGLQMSQVSHGLMPNLASFADGGVRFENHHSVFPTVTRVNVASITTGRYPGGHGIAGNNFLDRSFHPGRILPALRPELGELFEETGEILLVPNLAETLSVSGKEYIAIGTGSSGNAFLHNPHADIVGGAAIHPDFCQPPSLHSKIIERFGEWPDDTPLPAEDRIARGVDILLGQVLESFDPEVALIWSLEPDKSQHEAGVGSVLGNRGLAVADRQFGRILEWLDKTGRTANTDVIVASDHGYSTASDILDIESLVVKAGFPATSEKGGVMVAPNGGSVLFYVADHDFSTSDRLACWLMNQPWCGSMVSSDTAGNLDGLLPASLVGVEGKRAPDLSMSFKWDSSLNPGGYPGYMFNTGKEPGQGNHGSMSRHEQRCGLIVRGPNFKKGVVSEVASGNVDIMPTILHLLQVDPLGPMDGRVLDEALMTGFDTQKYSTKSHLTERILDNGIYRQSITVSQVGSTTYVDEGNSTGLFSDES